MANNRNSIAAPCRHRRQHRRVAWHEGMAPQDQAQEIQVWHTRNHHPAGNYCCMGSVQIYVMPAEQPIKQYDITPIKTS